MARFSSLVWILIAVLLACGTYATAHSKDHKGKSFTAPEMTEYFKNNAGRVEMLTHWKMLKHAGLAAGMVTIESNSLSLPAYYNVPSLKYVIKGTAYASLISPIGMQSNVRYLEKGDILAVPKGWTSWIWNNGTEEFKMVGVARTTEGHIHMSRPSGFHLFGGKEKKVGGLIHGFSKDVLSRAWDVEEDDVRQLVEGQQETGFIKVPKEDASKLVWQQSHPLIGDFKRNIHRSDPDILVKNGGIISSVNSRKLPWLKYLDLSICWAKLEEGALLAPHFTNSWRLLHFTNGKGRIEIVRPDGNTALQTDIQAGSNIVVPAMFPVSICSSENEKLEWVAFGNEETDIPSFLAGYNSVYHALPWEVLKHGFKVEEKLLDKVYRTRRQPHEVAIFPRPQSGAQQFKLRSFEHVISDYEEFVEALEHEIDVLF